MKKDKPKLKLDTPKNTTNDHKLTDTLSLDYEQFKIRTEGLQINDKQFEKKRKDNNEPSSSSSASASASSWDHLLASHARSSSPSLPFRHLDVGLQPSLFTKEAWERGAVLPTDRMTGGGDLVGESVLERVYARYMSEMSSS
eukprot:gb/GECH01007231.1/.p1 GENE.gb/GECH01007231.1/~~gb/GECH01007231.1/.p1  ORF type:complete len:142 (+),score=55.76 gb/GECH01007231.1/:1-426(+)